MGNECFLRNVKIEIFADIIKFFVLFYKTLYSVCDKEVNFT